MLIDQALIGVMTVVEYVGLGRLLRLEPSEEEAQQEEVGVPSRRQRLLHEGLAVMWAESLDAFLQGQY